MDLPSNHAQLIESRGLDYEILTDREGSFFAFSRIVDTPGLVQRGYAIYSPEGELVSHQVTDHLFANIAEALGIDAGF